MHRLIRSHFARTAVIFRFPSLSWRRYSSAATDTSIFPELEKSDTKESAVKSVNWSPEAIESMEKAIQHYGLGAWSKISSSINMGGAFRNTKSCKEIWESMQPWWSEAAAKMDRGRIWTDVEVQTLLEAVGSRRPTNVDWYQVSSKFTGRVPLECFRQWSYLLHRVMIWHKFELKRLEAAVAKHGSQGKWEKIAEEVGYRHSAANCRFKWAMMRSVRKPWSASEDSCLRNAFKEHGKRFDFLAQAVGNGRTAMDCRVRVRQIIRVYWTKDELQRMREEIENQISQQRLQKGAVSEGDIDWTRVVSKLNNRRSIAECRLKWRRSCSHRLYRGRFGKEEVQLIESLIDRFGKGWNEIAKRLNYSRSDEQLRHCYNRYLAKRQTCPDLP